MPDFYQKLVCITRHVIQFYQRPGWNTEHTNSLLMWQWHHFCFEVTREGLRPGWNCRHGKLFTQRPGWNKRILRKIQCVLIKSPVTCIQDERVPRLEPEEKRNLNLNPPANFCFLNGNKLWNLISYFRCIDVLVPDIPESLDIKIKRERYLAKEALQDADQILQKVLTDHESDRVDSGMILTI